jgi:hypothetical protein
MLLNTSRSYKAIKTNKVQSWVGWNAGRHTARMFADAQTYRLKDIEINSETKTYKHAERNTKGDQVRTRLRLDWQDRP